VSCSRARCRSRSRAASRPSFPSNSALAPTMNTRVLPASAPRGGPGQVRQSAMKGSRKGHQAHAEQAFKLLGRPERTPTHGRSRLSGG
jgi:hypothetical protein